MNRAELIDTLAKSTGQTKADSERWLSAFLSTVTKNMRKKEGVKIVGFGTFATAKRKARTGRNPQTGASIKIPSRTVPVFRAGAALKDTIGKQRV
ncbi:MAG: HU family DNA-binding protein [Deltaproteobacteria bacterium]|nr:HU family DNA-binding protein [Deltaproteobacteria bacterium]